MRLIASLFLCWPAAAAFQPTFRAFRRPRLLLYSSIGDGPPQQPPGGASGGDGPVDDFLDSGDNESENLKKAREYMSDESLPISFEHAALSKQPADGETQPEEPPVAEEDGEEEETTETTASSEEQDELEQPIGKLSFVDPSTQEASKLKSNEPGFFDQPNEETIRNNPYMKVVATLTPSDLISKFTTSAHPRVQNAVRSTILGLIGNLPQMAFDTTTVTTGQRLASLMFQLQMTGYLFKNAEYRLSLSQSLGELASNSGAMLEGSSSLLALPGFDDDDDEERDPLKGKIKGKLKIRYGPEKEEDDEPKNKAADDAGPPAEIEVDAAAYMSELRSEVSKLRDDLTVKRQTEEDAIQKDLLMYIRTLPEQELRSLTETTSQDVLIAMKGLVNVVMAGIGEGQIGPETVTEQSGEAMAQLCMWQLVVGYNLRELEVREEMKNSLNGGDNFSGPEGGADIDEPGAFD